MAQVTLVVPTFPKVSETFIVSKFVGLADRGVDIHVAAQVIDMDAWACFPSLSARSDLVKRVHALRWSVGRETSLKASTLLLQVLGQTLQTALRYMFMATKAHGLKAVGTFYRDAAVIVTRPELIHFEFGSLAAIRPELARFLGAKMVVSFRGYDLNYVGLDDPHYYAKVWDELDAVHLLGHDLLRRAYRRGLPSTLPYALIPPSIDTHFFSPAQKDDLRSDRTQHGSSDEARPLQLLSVGRLEWKKGYEYALSAVKILRDRGTPLKFIIIGAGEYSEAVRFVVRQLGLEEVVEIRGEATQSQVRSAMISADIFVHAAVSEGFCNAVIEAQAMELPIVTSDADGLPENVEDGVTGYVVSRRSAIDMARAIEHLAQSPELRRTMGMAGRRRVLQRFRLDDQIEAFCIFYRDVLARAARR